MIHYRSDLSNQPIPADELSELKLSGVVRQMTGRGTVHLSKAESLAFAKWLGFTLARPDVETVPGPEAPAAARE